MQRTLDARTRYAQAVKTAAIGLRIQLVAAHCRWMQQFAAQKKGFGEQIRSLEARNRRLKDRAEQVTEALAQVMDSLDKDFSGSLMAVSAAGIEGRCCAWHVYAHRTASMRDVFDAAVLRCLIGPLTCVCLTCGCRCDGLSPAVQSENVRAPAEVASQQRSSQSHEGAPELTRLSLRCYLPHGMLCGCARGVLVGEAAHNH